MALLFDHPKKPEQCIFATPSLPGDLRPNFASPHLLRGSRDLLVSVFRAADEPAHLFAIGLGPDLRQAALQTHCVGHRAAEGRVLPSLQVSLEGFRNVGRLDPKFGPDPVKNRAFRHFPSYAFRALDQMSLPGGQDRNLALGDFLDVAGRFEGGDGFPREDLRAERLQGRLARLLEGESLRAAGSHAAAHDGPALPGEGLSARFREEGTREHSGPEKQKCVSH
jgi:hypothetical protein